jgi:hypothetical protein
MPEIERFTSGVGKRTYKPTHRNKTEPRSGTDMLCTCFPVLTTFRYFVK